MFLIKPLTPASFEDAVDTLVSLRQSGSPKVLVVHHASPFHADAGRALERAGLKVHSLEEGELLMDALREQEPDALVLDADLSGTAGVELCAVLRASRRWAHLPIAFVAADGSREARLAAFRAGCDDYFADPVDGDELAARLRTRIERTQLMRERAEHDQLTGLSLRGVFLAGLEARLSEARRHGSTLALCLIDLDRFKQINDQYGHLAGDRVLAELARLMATRFRGEDLRARWGGEEFALAFPGERADTVGGAIDRLLCEFSAMTFQGDRGEEFVARFSAGVAEFPRDGDGADELLRAADRRLRRSKSSGRARVTGPSER
jgi:diguanylate cyclase (GGDEF)-like protein